MRLAKEPKRHAAAGDRFERLVVLGRAFYVRLNSHSIKTVVCECDCGSVVAVSECNLLKSATRSCGCLQREGASKRRTTHGGCGTKLYGVWMTMLNRCNNPNVDCYHCYGGKGIRVCEEWNDFPAFRDWAHSKGYKRGLTIERLDGNGNYEPGNCVWATRAVQAKNTSRNRFVEAFGETKILSDWYRDARCVVSHYCVKQRLKSGMTIEQALSTPSKWAKAND